MSRKYVVVNVASVGGQGLRNYSMNRALPHYIV
jgi:hypothetical protein